MVDLNIFRLACGGFATGVCVVTSIEPDGAVHGMTVQGFASVSLHPMLVLVSIGHNRNSYPIISKSQRFAVSILNENQAWIAECYASPAPESEKIASIDLLPTISGSRFISDALACLDCRVVAQYVAGDHTIFIGEAEEVQVNAGQPLIYFRSEFTHLK